MTNYEWLVTAKASEIKGILKDYGLNEKGELIKCVNGCDRCKFNDDHYTGFRLCDNMQKWLEREHE